MDPLYRSPEWRKKRLEVLERDGWMCQLRLDPERCQVEATEVDHDRPLIDGGAPLDEANLRAACAFCNRSKAGKNGRNRQLRRNQPSREW